MIGLALFTVLSLQGAGEPSAEAGDDRMGFHSTEGFVALITTIVGVPKRGHFDAKPARRWSGVELARSSDANEDGRVARVEP